MSISTALRSIITKTPHTAKVVWIHNNPVGEWSRNLSNTKWCETKCSVESERSVEWQFRLLPPGLAQYIWTVICESGETFIRIIANSHHVLCHFMWWLAVDKPCIKRICFVKQMEWIMHLTTEHSAKQIFCCSRYLPITQWVIWNYSNALVHPNQYRTGTDVQFKTSKGQKKKQVSPKLLGWSKYTANFSKILISR